MLSAELELADRVFPTALRISLDGPQDAFLEKYGVAPLLCIELPGGSASALLGDLLSSRDSDSQIRTLTALASPQPARPSALAPQLRTQLQRSHHFVVPLARRIRDSRAARITVGRVRDNGVVLRDATVSKLHAWFEMDEKGDVRVADAGSRNGSTLAGAPLATEQPVAVPLGVPLTFGNIHTFLCSPAALWEAFHG